MSNAIFNGARILLWLLLPLSVAAQGASLSEYQAYDKGVVFTLDNQVQVYVSPQGEGTVEVHYQLAGQPEFPGQALSERPAQRFELLTEKTDSIQLDGAGIRVIAAKSPFRLSFLSGDEVKVAEAGGFYHFDDKLGFRFALKPGEKLMGGGERVLGMDRRGHRMPLYNRAHYGYTTQSEQMYYSLPAVMSSDNYALVFDNTARGFLDIGHTESDVLQFEAVGGRSAYIVTVGNSLAEVSQRLVAVTGRQPLPPRWALGNFASRFGYRSQNQTEEVVEMFNQQDIPLDAVVLDLYWFGPEVKGHMGNLNWDKQAFPEPESMIKGFQEQGVQTVLITEPFILTTSSQFESAANSNALALGQDGKPKTFEFFFGNTGLVDVFSEPARDWFWQYYQRLGNQGVAGWWGDLGEPEVHPAETLHSWQGQQVSADMVHNAFGHQWAKMLYSRTLKQWPKRRPLVLMRSGFIGSQRYGMIPWTGDVSRSWGGLKPQIELSLQMGMFGLAYTHSDLGGFAGGEQFDPELYLRWLQLGVFQPVFRPHAQEDIAPEPVFHSEDVIRQARDLIRLRYQLLPYNYSLVYENSLFGRPLMRPLAYHYDPKIWFEEKDQFLWGESLLVSPVTEPGVEQWPMDLPEGHWYNYFTDRMHAGGQIVELPVDQERFGLMVKAGAILPLIDAVNRTSKADFSRLNVHHWYDPEGQSSQFRYFEDDGKNPKAIEKEQFAVLNFNAGYAEKLLRLGVMPEGGYKGMPTKRTINWQIHGLPATPKRIQLGAAVIAQEQFAQHSVLWDADNRLLSLSLPVSSDGEHSVTLYWD
ncbi:DUF5110 domain-containing protein [Alteromonas aestuariivivens]|uniref:DUF5110 domain-containing protein n=1 Tax=Alteromonas aestuariivivens TaxID=1938339 RepID=A0A3D8M8D2_9ALTE|nr:TIM-barrel domain-containing protein [Alteromonas aestuariivivens]RDV26049.1 DUF5110 domain-containing protein [Alteromonas aestuariivivens]